MVGRSVPVAHDDAVEAPFLPENVLEKSGVFCAVHAVDSPVSNNVVVGRQFVYGREARTKS